jgi:hypothetical protein
LLAPVPSRVPVLVISTAKYPSLIESLRSSRITKMASGVWICGSLRKISQGLLPPSMKAGTPRMRVGFMRQFIETLRTNLLLSPGHL